MIPRKEFYYEGRVKSWARARGITCLKLTPYGTAGYPDDLFLFCGRTAFIEFKRPGEKPRPLQMVRIAELREQGFPVGVIDNVDDGIAFLDSTLLSGAGGAYGHIPSVRGLSAAARHGEDNHQLRHNQDTEE